MNQTKHPAEIAYDNGGWDDDMDTLAHPLRDPNPDRAAQGAAAYRKVLENQLHLSQNVQPHAGYRLWIEDEITATRVTLWALNGLEKALSGQSPHQTPPPAAWTLPGHGRPYRPWSPSPTIPETWMYAPGHVGSGWRGWSKPYPPT